MTVNWKEYSTDNGKNLLPIALMKPLRLFLSCIALFFSVAAQAALDDGQKLSFAKQIAMPADNISVTRRPAVEERLFRSETIEKKIAEVMKLLKDAPLSGVDVRELFPEYPRYHCTLYYDGGWR